MDHNEVTGTDHDGLCECCDEVLTAGNLKEGDLGFYCSEACLCESEAEVLNFHEDFHADG